MSVELLKNVIARGAMAKNAASIASHPTVTWKHMSDAAIVAPVDKRAIVADLLQKNAGLFGSVATAGRNMISAATKPIGNAVAASGGVARMAPGMASPSGESPMARLLRRVVPASGAAIGNGLIQKAPPATPAPQATVPYKKDARAIVADLLQKNAGIVSQGLDLGRKGLSYLQRGASAAGNATLSGARQAADFTAAHPVAAIGTAGAAAGLGGGYIGGKFVGYNQGAKDKASQTNAQLARYGVTAGGAALGGIGGNMLAGAFGGGRVARTLATLLGAAGGGAAGYYAMDPAVQAKVKALFS